MKKPIPFGKYDLLERINVGGMAEVFRAKAYGVEGFERLVAVKRILPNIAEDKDFVTMFIDEAKISVQLNHANIAQIFDLGVVDSSYFIALEHIHGRDLRAIFERVQKAGEPMPVAQACFIVMKLCEGLDYAHQKRDAQGRDMNLVHRDVSPQNILVSFEGEIKIIDFGIAKAAGKVSRTQAGILKGKFGYMSPEQVRGLPIDRRSDIFSTGIVLYELLTNERLFTGDTDFATLEKVRNVEILPPSTYNRKIPDELERIILKALAKDVDDRYANAIDLHDELQAFVYTAGEFYSRKELAAWMKRTFAREIEEETAKIESYRSVPPRPVGQDTVPDGPVEPPASHQRVTQSHRRATVSAPAVAPPPERPRRITAPPPVPVAAAPAPAPRVSAQRPALEWDDDELETQIYDGAPVAKPQKSEPPPVDKPSRKARPANGTSLPPVSGTVFEARGTIVPEITVRRPATPSRLWFFIGAAAILVVGFGGYLLVSGERHAETAAAAAPKNETPPALPIDPATGFDISTEPPGAKVRLDGSEIGPAPLRVRGLISGKHQIEVSGLAGYKPQSQEINVAQGAALTLHLKLERELPEVAVAPAPPPPAPTVTPEPVPEPVKKPAPAPPPPAPKPVAAKPKSSPPPIPRPVAVETKPAAERPAPVETRPAAAAAASGQAFLTLGAKPPCTVILNGEDTGKTTPVRDLEVQAGSVSVTLVNSEFGIRESFTVNVAPGENKKVIRDFSDRLPK